VISDGLVYDKDEGVRQNTLPYQGTLATLVTSFDTPTPRGCNNSVLRVICRVDLTLMFLIEVY